MDTAIAGFLMDLCMKFRPINALQNVN